MKIPRIFFSFKDDWPKKEKENRNHMWMADNAP